MLYVPRADRFQKSKKGDFVRAEVQSEEPADLLFVRGFISKTGVLRQYTSRVALYIELCRLPRLHLSRFSLPVRKTERRCPNSVWLLDAGRLGVGCPLLFNEEMNETSRFREKMYFNSDKKLPAGRLGTELHRALAPETVGEKKRSFLLLKLQADVG